MLKPVCTKCQRFYRPKKNGIVLLEGMPWGDNIEPGTSMPDKWLPYKMWRADLWECKGCGHQIISGNSREPLWEHYKGPKPIDHDYKVNDC